MNQYRNIVIGSIERIPVVAKSPAGAVVNLTDADVTVRIALDGVLVVTDAVCVSSATGAYYDWDTTGLAADRYQIQFTIDFGDILEIEPAEPLTVRLVSRLGGA